MSQTPDKVRAALAANVRAARARLGIGQAEVVARMQAGGFDKWCHQTMSQVERGHRRILAEEIFGLATALETSAAKLMDLFDGR